MILREHGAKHLIRANRVLLAKQQAVHNRLSFQRSEKLKTAKH